MSVDVNVDANYDTLMSLVTNVISPGIGRIVSQRAARVSVIGSGTVQWLAEWASNTSLALLREQERFAEPGEKLASLAVCVVRYIRRRQWMRLGGSYARAVESW